MNNKNKQRVPVNPLPYSSRHKAGPKELLIEYNKDGKGLNRLYITDDNCEPVDITEQIVYMIENAKAENSTIMIENYGEVNLSEFLNLLNKKADSTIQMHDVGNNINYINKEYKLDMCSLESTKDRKIQIKGFDKAKDGYCPYKIGDEIVWLEGKNAQSSTPGAIVNNGDGENPKDGLTYGTMLQNISNHKVYLQASIRQKTIFPAKDFALILPNKTQDEFCQIWWLCRTNSFVPTIMFADNCFWKSIANSKLKPNCNHLYKFITYDHGQTWLAECDVYQFTSKNVSENNKEFYTVVVDK